MNKNLLNSLVNLFRSKRIKKGYTQKELSIKLDLNENSYQQIEIGKHLPSLELFFEICDVLEINIGECDHLKGK